MKWLLAWFVVSVIASLIVGPLIAERETPKPRNTWTEEELHKLGLR